MSIGLLRKCSVTYLLLPNLLFSLGWFRQPFSLFMVLGYVFLFYRELTKRDFSYQLSLRNILFLAIYAVAWTFFCGINGYTSQSHDWLAHNVKFYDLFKNEWPIYFSEVGRYARYYFGYYLVPAFCSKFYGRLLTELLVLWTFLGFFLGLTWVFVLINKSKLLLLLFICLRGFGQIVFFLLNFLGVAHLQAVIFNPSIRSIFEQSTYAPNQVIPALIACGILVHDFVNRRHIDQTFFVITLVFVWAVFPALTLMLVFAVLFIHRYLINGQWRLLTWSVVLKSYLIPGVILVPIFIYFGSSEPISTQGFLWDFNPKNVIFMGYISGIIVDFLIFYSVVAMLVNKNAIVPFWIVNVLFAVLAILSIYRIWIYNDLFFRGILPVCMILYIIILRGVQTSYHEKKWPVTKLFYPIAGLIVLLALGLLIVKAPLLRDNVIANYFFATRDSYKNSAYDGFKNTYQMLSVGYQDSLGAEQYLSSSNSLYGQFLSRNPIKDSISLIP